MNQVYLSRSNCAVVLVCGHSVLEEATFERKAGLTCPTPRFFRSYPPFQFHKATDLASHVWLRFPLCQLLFNSYVRSRRGSTLRSLLLDSLNLEVAPKSNNGMLDLTCSIPTPPVIIWMEIICHLVQLKYWHGKKRRRCKELGPSARLAV